MKEKDAELAAKDTELKTAQKNASDLDAQLKKSRKSLADLKKRKRSRKNRTSDTDQQFERTAG